MRLRSTRVISCGKRSISPALLLFVLGEGNRLQHVPELIDELQRQGREVVHEIERVFDFMRDPSSQLTERRKLLRLDEPILGGPKLLQRVRQFTCTSLDILE